MPTMPISVDAGIILGGTFAVFGIVGGGGSKSAMGRRPSGDVTGSCA